VGVPDLPAISPISYGGPRRIIRISQRKGFSVDNQVRIKADDSSERQQLARYMVRAPFSRDKTEYKAEHGVMV